jgi:phage gp16-like protein
MPKGPRGEKRPADAIGRAIKIAQIATGEEEDERDELSSAAAEMGRKGGKARAAAMSPERRKEISEKAAKKRWQKNVVDKTTK